MSTATWAGLHGGDFLLSARRLLDDLLGRRAAADDLLDFRGGTGAGARGGLVLGIGILFSLPVGI